MVGRRKRVKDRHSRKLFSKTAKRVNPKNMRSTPLRGGFRL